MDFIIDLLPSVKFDTICIVIDQFSKMAHFVLYKKKITRKETTKLFINNIHHYDGLLDDIISNREP